MRAIIKTFTSTSDLCPSSLTQCGSIDCYDRATHKCCPGKKNLCGMTENCVEVQLANNTIAHGCCPSGNLACGDTCFDTTTFKCCAQPVGAFGLCPAGADCCADMCCEEGQVCAKAVLGPRCWPKTALGDLGENEKPLAAATSAAAATTPVSATSGGDTVQASVNVSTTKSSGGARPVVPRLLSTLLLFVPSVRTSYILSPVNLECDIPEIKDPRESQ
ncbi:uncharacterized protein K460DRAFT_367208 [Cucurbitaria berberidis CBS 394.84]|uniref:Uncharacterized protein n=1 Tax=Cucurbitaria berberidis CBS 394.84 TaxID=1168544 RepID=A0A9P4GJL8_9PLEO|nr:uncharacterized protein K460DRAFT_367208 [Cucurbitaria berberidis CBS 394.84]KAF1846414.1 hypothetical protein K460DRAFT_367208 [Cucurbitaria berberidis CBS 394.84]